MQFEIYTNIRIANVSLKIYIINQLIKIEEISKICDKYCVKSLFNEKYF